MFRRSSDISLLYLSTLLSFIFFYYRDKIEPITAKVKKNKKELKRVLNI